MDQEPQKAVCQKLTFLTQEQDLSISVLIVGIQVLFVVDDAISSPVTQVVANSLVIIVVMLVT